MDGQTRHLVCNTDMRSSLTVLSTTDTTERTFDRPAAWVPSLSRIQALQSRRWIVTSFHLPTSTTFVVRTTATPDPQSNLRTTAATVNQSINLFTDIM